MIGIVVALKSEANSLIEKIQNKQEFLLADKPAFKGTICGKDVVLVISGIGKVSAGLSAQLLIDKYSPTFLVNAGTCGGMDTSVNILEYYAVEKCCQFDFDLRELDGVDLGYIQEYDRVFFNNYVKGLDYMKKAVLATADRFTNDANDINSILNMGAKLRDMEGGAIAQVCTSNSIPLIMIKGVTDVTGLGTAQDQFIKNLRQVSSGLADVTINAINSVYQTLI